jgi:hypothetical protein
VFGLMATLVPQQYGVKFVLIAHVHRYPVRTYANKWARNCNDESSYQYSSATAGYPNWQALANLQPLHARGRSCELLTRVRS